MTERELQIIAAINSNPLVSQAQLAKKLGISRSAIASHITNLTAKGIIEGRGYVIAAEKFCVAIGGANMDILGKPEHSFCPSTSNPGFVSSSPGGVARNIAENISRLGNKCYLIAAVGNDNHGLQLIEQSKNGGVDTSQMLTLDGHSTSCYLSIIDDSGEMQMAIADMKILDQLLPAHFKKQLPLLKQARLIVIDTNLSTQVLAYLFEQLPEAEFFVDTVSVAKTIKIMPFLHQIHSLKPNLLEAETLSGIKIDDYKQLPELAKWFHQQGVKRLFISLGQDGVFYSDQHNQQRVKLTARDVQNSNGAGDAMTAALAHCHMQEMNIHDSCFFALAAACCAIATQDTINPDFSILTIKNILKDLT
ncbi:MAG: pseudouridine kinase [Oceanospirillaceae bacterium]|jgi:pseudouridine kinase